MATLLIAVWSASLFGSIHCVGMCGPLALLAGTRTQTTGLQTNWLQVLGYHSGRLAAYTALGVIFGGIGQLMAIGGQYVGMSRATAYVTGILMIAMGGASLLRQAGFRWSLPHMMKPLNQGLQWAFRQVSRLSPAWKSLAIGGLTAMMPCGWLYVFLVTAAGVADPFWGGLTMVVFWAGTVPFLLIMVLGLGAFANRLPFSLSAVTAVLTIAIGVLTLTGRAQVNLKWDLVRAQTIDVLKDNLQSIDQETLPCCCNESVNVNPSDNRELEQ